MNRLALWILGLVYLSICSLGRAAAPTEPSPILIENLSTESEVTYNYETGIATGTNGVRIIYEDIVLTAVSATLDEKKGEVWAVGEVRLKQGPQVWKGDELRYNFRTREMSSAEFRTGAPPLFASGQGLSADLTNKVYTATNAVITTDDVDKPVYKLRAKRIKIVAGKRIEARGATLYLGPVPVMYLPYYRKNLDRNSNHWVLTPGYRSKFGPYLLTSYNWYMGEKLSGAIHMDYRLKRGFGAGPEVALDLGKWGQAEGLFYYTHDEDPGVEKATGKEIRDDRHRIDFSYGVSLGTNTTIKAAFHEQSDPKMHRDFFETEYRRDPQPRTFLEANHLWPNFSLNAFAQPQVNDFFQTVERLPDVKLSAFRQQLGVSPFFYEGENSLAYLHFRPIEGTGTNYSGIRADTFHQLLLPTTFFGWLNFTPRVGGRLTYYGETDGTAPEYDETTRAVFNTGAETSFKASRVWRGARSEFWEINGLRHIVQPSVNYVFVPDPKDPKNLPQYDTEWPSLRLLPLDFPDYNSIDSIDSQNVFRLGLRNKLQTKRGDEIVNAVNWALYTDWRVDPRPGQGTFADLYSDLDLRPRSWLTLNSELRYDIEENEWRLANNTVTILPNDIWSLTFGHRYFEPTPEYQPREGNNLFFTRLYYRFNENWGARISHHFEARDGVLEEQYYTLYRDLRSWTAALTFRVRDHRNEADDYTVAITFSLKAAPRYRLGKDRDDPSYLLGS